MKELTELQEALQKVSKIENLKKHTREKHHVLARALFATVAYQDFKISKIEISRFLGFNHATILHLIKMAQDTYKQGYPIFEFWHIELETYYMETYCKRLSDVSLVDNLGRLKSEARRNAELTKDKEMLKRLLDETRERLGTLKDFLLIPENEMTRFKETKLIPHLKMLGIKI